MTRLEVERFQRNQWSLYRDLRLSALEDSPDAFGSTLAEARLHPDSVWVGRLAEVSVDLDLPLLATVDDEAAGLAWGMITPVVRDTANIYQMWVVPRHRGLGAGKLLLERVLSWAGVKWTP